MRFELRRDLSEEGWGGVRRDLEMHLVGWRVGWGGGKSERRSWWECLCVCM